MSRSRWHIRDDGAELVLSRRNPPVLDVSAQTILPDAGRTRLAHQVRQDMWRALQGVRGFSPVICVRRDGGRLHLRAGGQVARPFDAQRLSDRIAAVLENPANRARWVAFAGGGR